MDYFQSTVALLGAAMPDPKKGKKEEQREIKHPKLKFEFCVGTNAMTEDRAKELLGWEVVDPKTKEDHYLLTDMLGNKVVCHNNNHNRRWEEVWSKKLAQDILNRHYKMNGEPIIIGEYGTVLSAQHRLIALIFACQAWEEGFMLSTGKANKETLDHWHSKWNTKPVIETALELGISEDPDVVRTFDCTKPRTIADTLYTTGVFEKGASKSKEDKLTKLCDYAVRLVWDRAGAKNDAYSPYRTNSEVMEFIDRHKRIPRAVNEMYKLWSGIIEGKDKVKIDGKEVRVQFPEWMLPPGTAAGILYLMAASMSDGDAYRAMEAMSEDGIDFKAKPPVTKGSTATDVWDKACEFWTGLQSKVGPLRPIIKVMESIASAGGSLSVREKMAVLTLGWLNYRDGKPVTENSCMPEFEDVKDEEGNVVGKELAHFPLIGGIDCGGKATEEQVVDRTEPSEEEKEQIEAEKEAVKVERAEAKKAELRKSQGGGGVELSDAEKKVIEERRKKAEAAKATPANGAPKATAKPAPAKQPALKGGIG